MKSDIFIDIGSTHKINEDYATHGEVSIYKYIAISDGCSASDRTDIGSRLLCLALEYCMKNFIDKMFDDDMHHFNEFLIDKIRDIKIALDIKDSILDATLIYAVSDGDVTKVYSFGDGNISVKTKDGKIIHHTINYEHNTPNYLSYNLDPTRKKGYIDNFFGDGEIIEYNDGVFYHSQKITHSTELFWEFKNEDIEMISVYSDGVETFMDEDFNLLNADFVASELTNFKNTNGVFLERRAKSYLRKCKKNKIIHTDDISVATIIFK